MQITIIGTGYVGLVTGVGLAEFGHHVTCVDKDTEKVGAMSSGICPIHEPGLGEMLRNNIRHKRIIFQSAINGSLEKSQAIFLAVGTPMSEDGSADLSQIREAAKEICEAAKHPLVLVTKSTVPVGTAEMLKGIVKEHAKVEISVASNPEFLKEGTAVDDFVSPDRIVIGTDDQFARDVLTELYRPFMMREKRIYFMDTKSAELTKYAANAMLATRISFMNEMAILCERVGANVDFVRTGMGSDRRIGPSFLYPGAGYGGSCFPKDVQALIHSAKKHSHDFTILNAVDAVNKNQRYRILQSIFNHFEEDVKGKVFTFWGIAFKPRTDDIREAPSITLMEKLLEKGARIRAYDRAAMTNAKKHFGADIELVEDEYVALDGADAMILMTEWAEFRSPDWGEIKRRMRGNQIFDCRNVFDPAKVRELGFGYYGVGRPTPSQDLKVGDTSSV